MEELEYAIGLHEEVSIINVVDGFCASLYAQDGARLILDSHGKTIQEALLNLNVMVKEQGITWQTIRKV